MIKEAILWEKMDGGKVECTACARRCRIPEGSHGFCFVRKNIGGGLKLVNYGTVAAMQLDPIEKKPLNHFMPGGYVFGIGTSSCNWGCLFCQNHNISKDREITGVDIKPDRIVDLAIENRAGGIAFTYNEPTIFIEYALDVAKAAHKKGLYTIFVTNGYMTADAVCEMAGLIDAVVVNFKGNGGQKFSNRFEAVVSNNPIKESLVAMKGAGIHIEITDLIIPRVGDSIEECRDLTSWICSKLGPDTPVQFTRFHPDYKMLDYAETPYDTLKRHYDAALDSGLNYVYIGNVTGNPYENTYCPRCKGVVIERRGFCIEGWRLDSGNKCKMCGEKIFMVGGRPEKFNQNKIRMIY